MCGVGLGLPWTMGAVRSRNRMEPGEFPKMVIMDTLKC